MTDAFAKDEFLRVSFLNYSNQFKGSLDKEATFADESLEKVVPQDIFQKLINFSQSHAFGAVHKIIVKFDESKLFANVHISLAGNGWIQYDYDGISRIYFCTIDICVELESFGQVRVSRVQYDAMLEQIVPVQVVLKNTIAMTLQKPVIESMKNLMHIPSDLSETWTKWQQIHKFAFDKIVAWKWLGFDLCDYSLSVLPTTFTINKLVLVPETVSFLQHSTKIVCALDSTPNASCIITLIHNSDYTTLEFNYQPEAPRAAIDCNFLMALGIHMHNILSSNIPCLSFSFKCQMNQNTLQLSPYSTEYAFAGIVKPNHDINHLYKGIVSFTVPAILECPLYATLTSSLQLVFENLDLSAKLLTERIGGNTSTALRKSDRTRYRCTVDTRRNVTMGSLLKVTGSHLVHPSSPALHAKVAWILIDPSIMELIAAGEDSKCMLQWQQCRRVHLIHKGVLLEMAVALYRTIPQRNSHCDVTFVW